MRRSLQRILALASKEVRHVMRDPRSLYLALGMPVIMILLFGYGVSFDLDRLPVGYVDLDASPTSREFRQRLTTSRDLSDAGPSLSIEEAERRLVAGEVVAVVVFRAGFEERLRRGEDAPVQVLIDGADNNTAVQVRAKIEAAMRVFGLAASTRGLSGGAAPIEARSWTLFNPKGLSAVFLVPGLVAYVLAIVAVMLTALTVAREWEKGSMAQLFATPVGRLEIVIGKLLPYMVLGGIAVLLVLAVGTWVFDVPFRGSAIALTVLSTLFLGGMLGQGLLISVITRNQMVATQAAAMSSMLPSMLLSGFVFPIENMPLPLRVISHAIPARYFVDGLRSILLRGNGLDVLWPEALALAAFLLLMIVLSTVRFRRVVA